MYIEQYFSIFYATNKVHCIIAFDFQEKTSLQHFYSVLLFSNTYQVLLGVILLCNLGNYLTRVDSHGILSHCVDWIDPHIAQRYTYKVLLTIVIKFILLCAWAEQANLSSARNALNFKYEI